MPLTNGMLTVPFNTWSVGKCIGHNSGDAGTLCSAKAYINKWAKYKPVVHSAFAELTEAQKRSVSYGITAQRVSINTAADKNACLDSIKAGNTKWDYNCPSTNDWKRLTDFDGYHHRAVNPFILEPNSYMGKDGDYYQVYFSSGVASDTVRIYMGETDFLPVNNIKISDIISVFSYGQTVEDYKDKGFAILYREEGSSTISMSTIEDVSGKILYPVARMDSEGKLVFNQSIPITLHSRKNYEICGIIINLQHGDEFLFPTPLLKIKILPVPDLALYQIDWTREGGDMVAAVTITRNGNNAWWQTHGTDIYSVRTEAYMKGRTTSSTSSMMYFFTNADVRKSSPQYSSWNGTANNSGTAITGSNSATFILRFTDTLEICKGYPQMTEVKIELTLNINNSTQIIQEMRGEGLLEDLGFLK